MTITSGSFDVGSGGDYATWELALEDIDGAGLTGDITFTQISDVTDTGGSDVTFPLGGFTLLMTSDTPHNGDFSAGHLWSRNTNGFKINCSGSGTLEMSDLRTDMDFGNVALRLLAVIGSTVTVKFHDMLIFKGGGNTTVTIESFDGGFEVYNNIIADMDNNLGSALTLKPSSASGTYRVFNNVIELQGTQIAYNLSPDNLTYTDIDINNNTAIVSGGAGWNFTFGASAELLAGMRNNATTDNTLAGTVNPVQSFIPATEFTSIVFGEDGYLVPTAESQFALGGDSTNSPTTVDITGATYGVNPPIGAYIAAAVVVVPDPLFFRILQHLWPISRAFDTTDQDKQFTELNQGLTALGAEVKAFADDVYGDIFPATTRELTAWETQWNLPLNSTLTEQERRDRLANAWSSLGGQSPKFIQDAIQGAGFTNVFLHEWWELPVVGSPVARNPNTILAGDEDLLVNIINTTSKNFVTGCGEPLMECGESIALCGQFSNFIFGVVEYQIPTNPELYPYFLYFGDTTFPTRTTVPLAREAEFKELLLKICPAQQWLGLLIDYV